jgi:DNA repair exonuclease SbcCD nuclease subunit
LSEIIPLLRKYEVEIFTIPGQHDQYFRSSEIDSPTNMSLLNKAGLVKILGPEGVEKGNTKEGKSIFLYGAGWGQEVPEPKEKPSYNIRNILVIHASIGDQSLSLNHEYIEAHTFAKKYYQKYNLILCGDIHREFVVTEEETILINTGPMLRLTAEDYSYKHSPSFYTLDTETGEIDRESIPCEDAEKMLTRKHIDKKEECKDILTNFIDSITNKKQEGEFISIGGKILKFCKKNKVEEEVIEIISTTIQGRDI